MKSRMKIRKLSTLSLCIMAILFTVWGCSTKAFFFYPTRHYSNTPADEGYSFEEVYISVGSKDSIHGWFIYPKQELTPKGTIIHLHGNAEHIGNQYHAVRPLLDSGFQAFVFDYRGYGKSSGTARQEHLLADALTAIDHVVKQQQVFHSKVILFGQSLGGHLACVAGDRRQGVLDAVVIEGAFTAYEEIAAVIGKKHYKVPKFLVKMMVPSRYDGIDHVGNIGLPLLVIHSTNDEVIPYSMGEELHAEANSQFPACYKAFWTVNGKHIRAGSDEPAAFVQHFLNLLTPEAQGSCQ